MSYKVLPTPTFKRKLKVLIKKYPSLKLTLGNLEHSLAQNPFKGVSLGQNCFKIRIKISEKNKGKSGGGRVVTVVVSTGKGIHLLTIFDKGEIENITLNSLKSILKEIVF